MLAEVKARYVVGLTATPQRRDGHHPITEMQLGPVRFAVDAKEPGGAAPVRAPAHRPRDRLPTSSEATPSIQELYAALAADETRNRLILNDVIQALERGALADPADRAQGPSRVLRRRGCETLARHLVVLQGGMGAKERREVKDRLAAIPNDEERLVLATGRYIGEGFDDARLDTLFLALPVSWKGTLVQYTGRLHRLHPGKTEVRIFDYVDREVPMLLRMFEKRLRGYRAIGYARGEAPLGYAEPGDEVVVEYDEDVPALAQGAGRLRMRRSARENETQDATQARRISKARLAEMIEEATVDAYGESEQVTGWFTMIEEHLALPFETTVLGVPVTVERVDLNRSEQIVAVCARGRDRQPLPILDLPLPTPPPDGAEWIEAYRQWRGEG